MNDRPMWHNEAEPSERNCRVRRVARMSYKVSFQKNGREIETLYWNGSLEETRRLATQVAIECKADAFQIFDSTDTETPLETHPPLPKQPNGSEVV